MNARQIPSSVGSVRFGFSRMWCGLVSAVLLFAGNATAQSISIQDASFDVRSLSAGAWSNTITPWQETGGPGSSNGFVEYISGFSADGYNHLGMALNHNVWQDLGVTYQANTRYTLTVAVGNRSGQTQSSNQSRYILADSAGTTYATGTHNASSVTVGTFADAPALVFETGSSSAAIGKTIRILLQAGGAGRSHFDKIRLTAAALQPKVPTVVTGTAGSVTNTGAILNGTVSAEGASTTVSFAYGLTQAYGSTANATPATITGYTTTSVSSTLSGLAPGSLYHYRVVATNSMGTSYGLDQTFTTGSPVVLSGLTPSEGTLSPAFASLVTGYGIQVAPASASIRFTPVTGSAGATIRVDGVVTASGSQSAAVPLVPGNNAIIVSVADGASSFVKTYTVNVLRPPGSHTFASSDEAAMTSVGFNATGLSINLSLGFAPATGEVLTVVNNTGPGMITGVFSNLGQGQRVNLVHEGITYPFVADYFGGTGNDLVLRWANTRLMAWGSNYLGAASPSTSTVPIPVDMTGVLAGKSVTGIAVSDEFSSGVSADGTLATWGSGSWGTLGSGIDQASSEVPVTVKTTGVLAGKTPVAVANGRQFGLTLCSDGTLAAWGYDLDGQLGDGTASGWITYEPVRVTQTGVLSGKRVLAIGAGDDYCVALCTDGTLATWGGNFYGQLGDGTTTSRNAPVLVNRTGVLSGKTVIAVAAGASHVLALCSDGTLAAWGYNDGGGLGDGTITNRSAPVLVNRAGVLAGKSVVSIACGSRNSYALCSDGSIAAWGSNDVGQLGNGGTASSSVPVLVEQVSSALAGRTVIGIGSGNGSGAGTAFARCADGALVGWGRNDFGQLGDNSKTARLVPVLCDRGEMSNGEVVIGVGSCMQRTVALVASPPFPSPVETLAATGVEDTGATLNGQVGASGTTAAVFFEYGPTTAYGFKVAGTPGTVAGSDATAVALNTTGLVSGTLYHYRVVAEGPGGTVSGADRVFTTTESASLASLVCSGGSLLPSFDPKRTSYDLTVSQATTEITFTATPMNAEATLSANGTAMTAGVAGNAVPLVGGNNTVIIEVASAGGVTQEYRVTITRMPDALAFDSSSSVPVTATAFRAAGLTANLVLSHAPIPGARLTVVNNTGVTPINGAFDNLAQGQRVDLEYNGVSYPFVANYFGGTGNDLVLQWANTRLMGWGSNEYGRVTGAYAAATGYYQTPVSADGGWGPLTGKALLSIAAGERHGLAACSDGTLVSWGNNEFNQLGRTTSDSYANRVGLVDTSGALAGKRVVMVQAGARSGLVLCDDGALVQWGLSYSSVPAAVTGTGALAGKRVVAISTKSYHSLALCSDGSIAAWGQNDSGQLGNGTITASDVPVAVSLTGPLAGKTVVAVRAGAAHSLAMCSDGTLAAWGNNNYGQLGDGTNTNRTKPVGVSQMGVLAGKTVVGMDCRGESSFALCSDGSLAAWGYNYMGILGDGTTTDRNLPVPVPGVGMLAGKTVSEIAAGAGGGLALCSDGSLVSWGSGALGHKTITNSTVPVLVDTTNFAPGELFAAAVGGVCNLAVSALPPRPVAEALAATGVLETTATLNGRVRSQGLPTTVTFEYGPTEAYGTSLPATPATTGDTGFTAAAADVSGLVPATTYHFRMISTNAGGTVMSNDMTFTTPAVAVLTGLSLSRGTLSPGFSQTTPGYAATVPFASGSITLTPVVADGTAVVTVNGIAVASGDESDPVALAVGENRIEVVVSVGAQNRATYVVKVLRLPESIVFSSAGAIPIETERLVAEGDLPGLSLAHAPAPGAELTVIRVNGAEHIEGKYANLPQGRMIRLEHNGIVYPFVANYYGGNGNDLVLSWANTRLITWGSNNQGQLGNPSVTNNKIPGPVAVTAFGGRAILAATAEGGRCLALLADGSLMQWGRSIIWNGSNWVKSDTPVAVDLSGVLAGKQVTRMATGLEHSLVLCADGTLASWGANAYLQLGNAGTGSNGSATPVAVDQSGVLAGRKVVDIAVGDSHNLALCADGAIVAWGYNFGGQLGDGTTTNRKLPVPVDRSGILATRTVTAIAAGGNHCQALCADGMLVAWGYNYGGQLGNGTTTSVGIPTPVERGGLLAGKTVTGIACGGKLSLALCSDGNLASWGGSSGISILGNGTTTTSPVPVWVTRTGVLAGKTIGQAKAGGSHSTVLCTDGTLAAWGYNLSGQVGNNTTTSATVPVLTDTSVLITGEKIVFQSSGTDHNLALAAMPPPPVAATLPATAVMDFRATLNAEIQPNGSSTSVSFEFGTTTAYGTTVFANPVSVTGAGTKAVSGTISYLSAATTYHYRIVATSAAGTVRGEDKTFTTTDLSTLADLTTDRGPVSPGFDRMRMEYLLTVPFAVSTVSVIPQSTYASAVIKVSGVITASGAGSAPLPVAVGNTTVPVDVSSPDGLNTRTYQIVVTRMPETLAFPSAGNVPVTAANFAASGTAPEFSLGHAPATGAALTVVNNTGAGPIQGRFGNLVQGQRVVLEHGGITYPFVANYYGGTGNDLVLEWENVRLYGWGYNTNGQLGNGTVATAVFPWGVPMTGVLGNQRVVQIATGNAHSLALCADGSLAAWGSNESGRLGNNSTGGSSATPVAVYREGALAGKTVIAISAGDAHSLALCTDGTLAAWGYNFSGQLGNTTTSNSPVPVPVSQAGVLAGKTVVAIAAGGNHSLALCADGTLAAWGYNYSGQLGNGTTGNSPVPVQVNQAGVLAGKTVTAIAAGREYSLALCAGGILVAWGNNYNGQLGDGTTTDRYQPVLVNQTGVLAGKVVTGIAAARNHSLVLCADGTLAAWGNNGSGQLGNNSTTSSSVPVSVTRTGALAGRTVLGVACGSDANGNSHSLARCADGNLATWGNNGFGQLGINNTTSSNVPVLVSRTGLATDERFVTAAAGGAFSLALSALPPVPAATTLAADGVTDNTATLRASVRPNGSATPVSFEYGRTSAYGYTVAATPATVSGGGTTEAAANLTNLQPGTTYHFRVVAAGPGGTAWGEDTTFITGTMATLSDLTASSGRLQPNFDPLRHRYSLTVSSSTTAVALTPVAAHSGAAITVNGVAVDFASASAAVPVGAGNTVIPVGVTAADGSTSTTYTVTVTRVPEVFEFGSATGPALMAEEFDGSGLAPAFTLAFLPVAGTELRVVTQTGLRFFRGRFANLEQGQSMDLVFNGIAYRFVADYFGGTGNDLVLRWANARLTGTGGNGEGQLGDGSKTSRSLPTAVVNTGVLSGKTVVAVAAGGTHTVALCSDGTLAAWGTDAGWSANAYGQLGTGDKKTSTVPVAVKMSGAMAGRRVVAVAAGYDHTLALCDDGAVLGWGSNGYRQLGNTGSNSHAEPVLLEDLGALTAGGVVSIAATNNASFALCADGSVAAWGSNTKGELGDGTTVSSGRPVAVSRTGVLAEKEVVMISAGNSHLLALCADGTLVAWGANDSGQLGTGETLPRLGPVAVKPVGALAGKTVVEVAAGNGFNLVRCSDNTLVSWGTNGSGQLGNGTTTASVVPVAVNATGVLAGKSIARLAVGGSHCMVYCTDATLAGWGGNSYGALGNNSTGSASSPVAASAAVLGTGERFRSVWTNASAGLSMILVASPPAAGADTLAATAVADARATLNGLVKPNGSSTTINFEYGLTESYGSVAAAVPSPVSGGETAVAATLTNLIPGTLYHFRIRAVSGGGVTTGADRTFTTTQAAGLAALAPGSGALAPAFESRVWDYHFTVPNAVASVTLTPTAMDSGAVTEVAGAAVPSGAASAPVSLAVGNTPVSVRVTSGDGVSTQTYTVNITRLPAAFVFATAGTVPVNAPRFSAAGLPADIALGFAPSAGTELRVVDVTGPRPIDGRFSNLAQGQVISLEFGGVSYPFVADYFGGTGNDLVLRWANTRLLAWGYNGNGQLGNGSFIDSPVPVAVEPVGALVGKTVAAVAMGGHRLALGTDGTVVAWGRGGSGQLGNNTTADSSLPVAVDRSGVLAGKRVVRVAAGYYHSLALCEDGTLAAWGENGSGQLGNGTQTSSTVPVAVDRSGVLADKIVIAISGGNGTSYAVCADGTVAAWGANGNGQLADGTTINRTTPVAASRTGVLAGKTVVEVAGGTWHAIARCSDSTLVGWGRNNYGQLGNGIDTDGASPPVAVRQTGVLAGKVVTQVAVGDCVSMALCADGTVAVWGWNQMGGGMGIGSSTYPSNVPVAVDRSGVLAGKTVTAVATTGSDFLALCRDGFAATWGSGSSGMLGNSSATSGLVPVALDLALVRAGERLVSGGCGLAMVASPPKSAAQTLAATATSDTTATLVGRVLPNGGDVALAFEYGLTESYGEKVAAAPATASGTAAVEATATLSGLMPGTTYHCRFAASGSGGTATGEDFVFTTTSRGMLAGLEVDGETLHPAFTPGNVRYAITVPAGTDDIIVRPTASHPSASVTVNGSALSADGTATVALQSGSTAIDIAVIAGDGINAMTYRLVATRLPAVFGFGSADTVPASADAFDVGGLSAAFSLGFAPQPGTLLTVLDNTGSGLISGEFANLPQGGIVVLEHGGIAYRFAADYYGGTGNDLVLRWADIRLLGWGSNSSGQLGTGVSGYTRTPVSIDPIGALAGKTVLQMVPGDLHCLAVCTDGSLAAWGRSYGGNLGSDGFQSWVGAESVMPIPIAVEFRGALAGRRVATAALSGSSNLVLCTDGALVTWGGGDNDPQAHLPKLVDQTGVLAGKQVVAIAGGGKQYMALCADGTLASWGGVLGNGTAGSSGTPVLVDRSGVLKDKTVVAIAAGGDHSMALCADGTLATWGGNQYGQLGDATTTGRLLPVRVDQNGVLAGKRVIAITAGNSHSLVLCADGTVAAWGRNFPGSVGNGTKTESVTLPVATDLTGVLAGKTIRFLAAGEMNSFALAADGFAAAWGYNYEGQLGVNSTSEGIALPAAIATGTLSAKERFVNLMARSSRGFAWVATPPMPVARTLAADSIGDTGAAVHGQVHANGNDNVEVYFEYGLTETLGSVAVAVPPSVGGTGGTAVDAMLAGLLPGVTYHVRVVAKSATGTVRGEIRTFTTGGGAALAGLTSSVGTLAPAFTPTVTEYRLAVMEEQTRNLSLVPVAATSGATVTVDGSTVASGSPSVPKFMAAGNHTLDLTVASPSGGSSQTYRVNVAVVPGVARFASSSDVPVRTAGFNGVGLRVRFELAFAPRPGTRLLVVENGGFDPITSPFDQLAHGAEVILAYDGRAYRFLANYRGGDGNDLTLEWGSTRMVGWGANYGMIGNGQTASSTTAVPTFGEGALLGKTVFSVVAGDNHALALCSDGTLAAWGDNGYGQVGNGSNDTCLRPVAVDVGGVLAGKTVTVIAAGSSHSLALCSDGTLAGWGNNQGYQLGAGAGGNEPKMLDAAGVLAGRTIIAITAGRGTSYALCSDGTVAAWGNNSDGNIGNGTLATALKPVLVDRSGVLAGRKVVSIAAGSSHVLALCADGALAAWGSNQYGQLGDNSNATPTRVPVLVNRSGVLAGKRIVGIAAGDTHSLVLCDDGSMAAWGSNDNGQLGNGSASGSSLTPVAVLPVGALAGKRAVAVRAGKALSLALCDDGTTVAWGDNANGQLGNGSTTDSPSPVAVGTANLIPGERAIALATAPGALTSLALTAMPRSQRLETLAATAVGAGSATLHGLADPDGGTLSGLVFEHGPTSEYGSITTASPATTAAGDGQVAASATLDDLPPGTIWHYRLRGIGDSGPVVGDDVTFTTGSGAMLKQLAVDDAPLFPSFDSRVTRYAATVPFDREAIEMSVEPLDPSAVITVNATPLPAGGTRCTVPLKVGSDVVSVVVTSGAESVTYAILATRLPKPLVFGSADDTPLVGRGFHCGGADANISLRFAPPVGTSLTLVRNDGGDFIAGVFRNLPHGGAVGLEYNGTIYQFVANYFGGDGNDLVLEWANTHWIGWGYNYDSSSGGGALGNGTIGSESRPVLVANTGVLAGRRISKVAAGGSHSLFLLADGTLAAAGDNGNGQLGINSTTDSTVGVAVDRFGVLAGKTVAAIEAGSSFSLVLCSDGTLAAWGSNSYGQLGDGTTSQRLLPVAVNSDGALAGRKVAAITAGENHAGALCVDGSVVAWGSGWGVLPQRVNVSSLAPHGRIISLRSRRSSFLALCEDGGIFTWTATSAPVQVDATAFAGRKVVAISSGYEATYALCADGSVFAWGGNSSGQLGIGTQIDSLVPVAVSRTGPLAASPVAVLGSGASQGFALCADGRLAAWGWNHWGQLGDGTQVSPRTTAVEVDLNLLTPGERVITPPGSSNTGTLFAQVAAPLPEAVTLPATAVAGSSATLRGSVLARGSETRIWFEYGPTDAYGMTAVASPEQVQWKMTDAATAAALHDLAPGTTYHFRVVAASASGIVRGADATFTTGRPPVIAGHALGTPFQTPATVALRKLLAKASDPDGDAISITSAGPASANGGAVALLADAVRYTPPNGFSGTDTFTIVLTDEGGASTTGTVTVQVGSAPNAGTPAASSNPPKLTTLPGGKIGLSFQGIPGRSYIVQRSAGGLDDWQTLATVIADATGGISYTDENPPPGSAFYRLGSP